MDRTDIARENQLLLNLLHPLNLADLISCVVVLLYNLQIQLPLPRPISNFGVVEVHFRVKIFLIDVLHTDGVQFLESSASALLAIYFLQEFLKGLCWKELILLQRIHKILVFVFLD